MLGGFLALNSQLSTRQPMIEINWNPDRKELRVFSVLWLLFFCLVAGLIYARTGSGVAAGTIGGAALLADLLGLCFPRFMRLMYVGWMLAVFPIGWVVSHVAIAVVYYLVLTPIGLVMHLSGRDALGRVWDRSAESYWQPHEDPDDPERYFRQF